MSPGLHGGGPRLSDIHTFLRLNISAPPKKLFKFFYEVMSLMEKDVRNVGTSFSW